MVPKDGADFITDVQYNVDCSIAGLSLADSSAVWGCELGHGAISLSAGAKKGVFRHSPAEDVIY